MNINVNTTGYVNQNLMTEIDQLQCPMNLVQGIVGQDWNILEILIPL
jgi:hypothetical protein